MAPLRESSAEVAEIQRLHQRLPSEMRSQISIGPSMAINPPLIVTEYLKKHRFEIQIDVIRWQDVPTEQRDLLFWHEVARIESKTVPRFGWEMSVMGAALVLALIEVMAQNVISLSAYLVALALAAHQLYQRKYGERSLREAVAADRRAIALAMKFGYPFADAATSLYHALNRLAKFAQKSHGQKYQARLRALEIFVTERDKQLNLSCQNLVFS